MCTISLVDQSLENLELTTNLRGVKVPIVIHLQSKNVPLIEPYLHSRAVIRIKVPRRAQRLIPRQYAAIRT